MSQPPTVATRTPRRRRLAILAVCGLFVSGLGVGLNWYLNRSTRELDAAEQALARHDISTARTRIDRVLARQPDDQRALFLAAQAARRADAYGDAERFLTAVEERSSSTQTLRREWALLGVQQGDFGVDEEPLRIAVGRNHPQERVILEALAKGYVAAFRWEEARASLARLLEQEPDHIPALILRSVISDRFRRAELAEADLRRAVGKEPDNVPAQAALAEHLSRRGHTREAIYHYELALRLQPDRLATRLGLARALADSADLDGAEQQLDTLLAADANHADGLVERGRLALRRGRFSEAVPFLKRATRAAPWHRDAHQLLLVSLKELGRSDDAAKCEARLAELAREDADGGRLKLIARDNPGEAGVRMQLWEWSVRNGQIVDGVAWLTEVLRTEPQNAQAHAAFAEYFERVGQPRRAAQHRALAAGK